MTNTAQSAEQITASEAEKVVRAYWQEVCSRVGDEEYPCGQVWIIFDVCCPLVLAESDSGEVPWLAAYQFTLEHKEQMRQIVEDVCGVDATRDRLLVQLGARILENNNHGAFIGTRALCSCARILARLEAIRADLRLGVKA